MVFVALLAGLAVLSSRPAPAAARRLIQGSAYPVQVTLLPFLSETPGFGLTPDLVATLFAPEPTLAVTLGPNLFRTEDAAMLEAFATPASSQTLPATRTPTASRTSTVTRTPTPTFTATLIFTPTATGVTATSTASATITVAPAVPGSQRQTMDWKVFGIGFSIPLLVVVVGALALIIARGRQK